MCGGFTPLPQGSERGSWKPGPCLAAFPLPSEPFPLVMALSISQRTLGRCSGQRGPVPACCRGEVSRSPRPVLITNMLKRYFCLLYPLTLTVGALNTFGISLRPWICGFQESTHLEPELNLFTPGFSERPLWARAAGKWKWGGKRLGSCLSAGLSMRHPRITAMMCLASRLSQVALSG